jgi:rRNA methylases
MLTKNEIKLIQSLKLEKYRKELGLFVIEGRKMVNELIDSNFEIEYICATEDFLNKQGQQAGFELVTEKQMEQMSSFKTQSGVLAVAKIPKSDETIKENTSIIVALDGINNPGNMGTIIRTCDWYGIQNIVCSEDCVEAWNPKVIQSTMGSIFRTKSIETNLEAYLKDKKQNGIQILGALMEGENIYKIDQIKDPTIVVIGSESHGIRANILPLITKPINIPRASGSQADSLNASMATGIIISEIYRKSLI